MRMTRTGSKLRRRAGYGLLLLSYTVTMACGDNLSRDLKTPLRADNLRYQLFKFPSGGPFSASLADHPVALHFTNFRDNRSGYFGLAVPALAEVGGSAPRLSGYFDTHSCTFQIKSSNFPKKLFPDLQTGNLKMKSCKLDAQRRSLFLIGRKSALASESDSSRRIYNFVIVLTDDQRWDTLWAMPLTEKLANRGARFNNSYTTSLPCCPFRASLLAGGLFTKNTNVLTNSWPNGGVERFDDTATLATELYDLGYATGLFGKYMNGLATLAPRIPAGWTEFAANVFSSAGMPEISWSDFFLLQGSRWTADSDSKESGTYVHVTTYSPYYYQQRALSFLDRVGDAPFFLYVATRAPHDPATPAPEDALSFAGWDYRGRAYGESDVSDKPEWVRFEATKFETWKKLRGDLPRRTLQSLQAVDRLVDAISRKIADLDALDDTIIFFTSDSGFQWLEHRLTNKGAPYEEALRVPFIVSMPGAARREDDHLIAPNLDIGGTILRLVGSTLPTDGKSLLPHLLDDGHDGRKELYFEKYENYYTPKRKEKSPLSFPGRFFVGLRLAKDEQAAEWKYVEHYSGERELYELVSDPYEMNSLHGEPEHVSLMNGLSARLRDLKGLAITTVRLPKGKVGEPYAFRLAAQGGQEPYSWSVIEAQVPGIRSHREMGPKLQGIPKGVVLEKRTGMIRGTPTSPGRWDFVVEVKDSSKARRGGGPQTYYEHLSIQVRPR